MGSDLAVASPQPFYGSIMVPALVGTDELQAF